MKTFIILSVLIVVLVGLAESERLASLNERRMRYTLAGEFVYSFIKRKSDRINGSLQCIKRQNVRIIVGCSIYKNQKLIDLDPHQASSVDFGNLFSSLEFGKLI